MTKAKAAHLLAVLLLPLAALTAPTSTAQSTPSGLGDLERTMRDFQARYSAYHGVPFEWPRKSDDAGEVPPPYPEGYYGGAMYQNIPGVGVPHDEIIDLVWDQLFETNGAGNTYPDNLAVHYTTARTLEGLSAQGVAETLVEYVHRIDRSLVPHDDRIRKLQLIRERLALMDTLLLRAKVHRMTLKESNRTYQRFNLSHPPMTYELARTNFQSHWADLDPVVTESDTLGGINIVKGAETATELAAPNPSGVYRFVAEHVRYEFSPASRSPLLSPNAPRFFANVKLTQGDLVSDDDSEEFLGRADVPEPDSRYHELAEPVIEIGGVPFENRVGFDPASVAGDGRVALSVNTLSVHDQPPYYRFNNSNNSRGPQFYLVPLGAVTAYQPAVAGADESGSCECTDNCAIGTAAASVQSAGYHIALGRDRISGTSAGLRFHFERPAAGALAPDALALSGDLDSEVLRDASGALRQFVAGASLVDVTLLDPALPQLGYTLSGHRRDRSAAKDADGLYPVPATPPVFTVELRNADPSAATHHAFFFIRTVGTKTETAAFHYSATETQWTLAAADARRIENLANTDDPNDPALRTETRTIEDPNGGLVSRVRTEYKQYPFGEKIVSETLDPTIVDENGAVLHQGRNRTTFFDYDDGSTSPYKAGLLTRIVAPTGGWTRNEYDDLRRLRKSVTGHGDAPPDAPDDQCRATTHSYSSTANATTRTTVVTLLGHEIVRFWRQDLRFGDRNFIRSVTPGAAIDDPSNLRTEYRIKRSGPFPGRTGSIVATDGTGTLFDYAIDGADIASSDAVTTTIDTGQLAGDGQSVVDGTRTVTVENRRGVVVSSIVSDIASGIVLSRDIATTFDESGRATTREHLDGTTTTMNYDCCGVANQTGRTGVQIEFDNSDDLAQIHTRLGVRTETRQLDMARPGGGRIETSVRTPVDPAGNPIGPAVQIARREYDASGIMVAAYAPPANAEVEPDPADLAARRLTTYIESIDPASGHLVRTVTAPDGSTAITENFRDGRLHRTFGTAVRARRHVYGVESPDGASPPLPFTHEILLDETGADTAEWAKTYTDIAGRVVHTLTSAGAVSRNVYNVLGQLVSDTDPDGVTTLYGYDPRGRLDTAALDLNRNGLIDFDGSDRITRSTTAYANRNGTDVVRTTHQVWTTDGDGAATAEVAIIDRSTDGLQAWSTSEGQTIHTETTYAGGGNYTIVTTYPDGTQDEAIYLDGRLGSERSLDAIGTQITATTHAYDSLGRRDGVTDARNGDTTFAYYLDDSLKSTTGPDPDGAAGPETPRTTAFVYDPQGRRDILTLPDGQSVDYDYLPTGEMSRVSGARSYTADYTYDHAGRLKTLTAGAGLTTWNYHADSGFLQSKIHHDGSGTSHTHTAAGRPLTTTLARGLHRRHSYDNGGRPVATDYFTDSSESTIDASTPAVAYTYARTGNIETLVDAAGVHTYTITPTGRPELETIAGGILDGASIARSYDSLLRSESIAFALGGQPLVHSHRYDDAGRYQRIAAGPDPATAPGANYTYHPDSNLLHTTTSTDAADTTRLVVTRQFDQIDRLRTITATGSAPSNPLNLARTLRHNPAGQRDRIELADGSFWEYQYDALGQLESATKKTATGAPIESQTFGFTYDSLGNRLTATNGAAAQPQPPTATYSPNALNQYTAITHPGNTWITGQADPAASISVDGTPAVRPGPAGAAGLFEHLATIDNSAAAVLAQHEISAELNGQTDTATLHQRIPPASTAPQYDLDGNLLQDALHDYTWDGEDRLIRIETRPDLPAEFPRIRLDFAYDAVGRRIEKKVSGLLGGQWRTARHKRFLYDGWNLLAEDGPLTATQWTPTTSYLWGIDLSGTLQGAGGTAGLLHIQNHHSGEGHFAAYDARGNVAALVSDATGETTARYQYAPYGGLLQIQGPAAHQNPFRFSTRYQDQETSHYYYGYRHYDPTHGRWLSRDPIGELGGLNLNALLANNPIDHTDYLGYASWRDYWNSVRTGKFHSAAARGFATGIGNVGGALNDTAVGLKDLATGTVSTVIDSGEWWAGLFTAYIYDDQATIDKKWGNVIRGVEAIADWEMELVEFWKRYVADESFRQCTNQGLKEFGIDQLIKLDDILSDPDKASKFFASIGVGAGLEATGAGFLSRLQKARKLAKLGPDAPKPPPLPTTATTAVQARAIGAPKRRVLWTGGDDALEAATTFARANGATTLEMTVGGRTLTKLTELTSPRITAPLWRIASKRFAKGAEGDVNVFFKGGADGARRGSVFQTRELPEVLENRLNIIYHNVD